MMARLSLLRANVFSGGYIAAPVNESPGQVHAGRAQEKNLRRGLRPAKAAPQPDSPTGKDLVTVKAPIVGTFYESASPGSPPFVRVGETVQPGKVLCIIESMKLMNEIEAEIAGMIESKLVPNGQPVEYGEALFAIRPV